MHEQQPVNPAPDMAAHPRDPQNFTRGDVIAWKVVAYVGSGAAVIGIIAALIAAITFATA